MDTKNLRKLRARLRSRKNPVGFNMSSWFIYNGREEGEGSAILKIVTEHSCGTVACLAGHAAILALQEGAGRRRGLRELAIEFLDLDTEEAYQLFHGYWSPHRAGDLSKISKAAAVRELTRLIEVGEAKA